MHIYTIQPFASKNGKAVACDVFHTFAGKTVQIGQTRRFVTYPAGVRASTEARNKAIRHARALNVLPENMVIKHV
jgi:hypothetical protein